MDNDLSYKDFVSKDALLFPQQHKERKTYQRTCADLIIVIACIICVVTCFVAISCAIYCLNAMQTMRRENEATAKQNAIAAAKSKYTDYRDVIDRNYMNGKDDIEHKYSISPRAKRSANGKNGNRRAHKRGNMLRIATAHFEGFVSNENVQNIVGLKYGAFKTTPVCGHVSKLQGKLCLNRTFYPDNDTLRIFAPANWTDDTLSPVTFNNSILSAKTGGVYFVYAQVLIGGKTVAKAASIVQKRNGAEITSLSCHTGVNADHQSSDSSQHQTCAVSGLMMLQEKDTLEIQKNRKTTEIEPVKSGTYFGVFQLSQENIRNKKQ